MLGTDTADIKTTNIYIVKANIKIVKWITPSSVAMFPRTSRLQNLHRN